MRLAVFDLDNTLLAGDSDYLWGRFLVSQGVVDGERYDRENQRFFAEYRAGTLDIEAFSSFSLEPLTRHPTAHLQALRARFVDESIRPIVALGTRSLLERHRAAGAHLLITTATNRFIAEPIAALLGAHSLIATEPEQINGRYTGRLAGVPNFQAGKVVRLRQWLDQHPVEVRFISAYSDSHNDLPLLEMADEAVAVDPDPILEAVARTRGWPVISLRQGS